MPNHHLECARDGGAKPPACIASGRPNPPIAPTGEDLPPLLKDFYKSCIADLKKCRTFASPF